MARFTHDELADKIESLTVRYAAGEFPFSDAVMSASLYALGLRGDDLREAMNNAIERKANVRTLEPGKTRRRLKESQQGG